MKYYYLIDNLKLLPYADGVNENSKDNNNNQKRGRNGKQKSYCEYIYNISENNTMTKPIVHAQININNNNLQISNCLIDSGAMQGNYVNGKVAEWLTRHNATIIETKKRICSCFNECRKYNNVFVNKISFENVNNNKIITFETNFTVIPELQFEVVIGYPDITKYDLFKIINKTNIMTDTTGVTTGDFVEATHRQSKQTTAKVAQLTVVDLLDTRIVATPHSSSEVYTPKLDETLGKPIHISEYLDYEPGSDGIPWNYSSLDETLHSEHIHTTHEHTNIQSNIPTDIRGTISLKTRVNALLTSYSDVFSKTLSPIPADITPMELDIDVEKWKSLRINHGPPRIQTPSKEEEIVRQINEMLRLNIIEVSEAANYSHVHLTPNPNDK